MGALTLPSSGLVYLDADAIIYSVEKIEPYASLFPRQIRQIRVTIRRPALQA